MNVKQAEKVVKDLEAERARLVARQGQLEADRDTAPVGKLAGVAAELGALGATVDAIDGRLSSARSALRDARQAQRDAAVQALRPREADAFDQVVSKTLVLRDALRDLEAVRRELRKVGGLPRGEVGRVAEGVRGQLHGWHIRQGVAGQVAAGKVRLTFGDWDL